MKRIVIVIIALFITVAGRVAVAAGAIPGEGTWYFDKDEPGKAPDGFTIALTGEGGPARWIVQADTTDPAGKFLAQVSTEGKDYRFPLCIFDAFSARDASVFVAFKAVGGTVDQAAGLVVRYLDKDNYYVVRANALEDNVRLYKVVKGKRIQFAGADVKVPKNEWHTLGLAVAGSKFDVSMDGKPLLSAEDATFKEAGKVGLWTKADSVTRFDKLQISAGK